MLSGRKTSVITPDKNTELGSRTPVCLVVWLVGFVLFAGSFHLVLFSARGFSTCNQHLATPNPPNDQCPCGTGIAVCPALSSGSLSGQWDRLVPDLGH